MIPVSQAEAKALVDKQLESLPMILRPRHEWSCEPCGVRMVFLRTDDLETNKQNHLNSEMHRTNIGG